MEDETRLTDNSKVNRSSTGMGRQTMKSPKQFANYYDDPVMRANPFANMLYNADETLYI